MNNIQIPIGNSNFRDIREHQYYYVDKSDLIRELLKTSATQVTLITRPRRFGKTLGISMLAEFFDIRKDSSSLFDGLQISEQKLLCNEWMNKWPVLSLSCKDIDGLTPDKAYGMLQFTISQVCVDHAYLEDSVNVDATHKEIFRRLKKQNGTPIDVQSSLYIIMRMMMSHFQKPVILLLDEYDVPLAKASGQGYYREMLSIIRGLLGQALKDNPALKCGIITGCLRIAKESIFTGINNLVSDTISDNRFSTYFGFTPQEVQSILADTRLDAYSSQIRSWYNGYHFGQNDIYCPWDVLCYVNKLLDDPSAEPESFWEHTSDNAIIGSFLSRTELAVNEKFETLLAGDYIKETITENLTYDILHASEDNLWSVLYLTGYLTRVPVGEMREGDSPGEDEIPLKIPNEEIKKIFQKSIMHWSDQKAIASDRSELFRALWAGDADEVTQLLSDLLFDTISYHDYRESFYHAFLAGLFASSGYIVESNYENGLGRSDIVMKDRKNRQAIVMEAKHSGAESAMEKDCDAALRQIEERGYAKKLEHSGFSNVIRYGVAFYQKRCLVKVD
jgi:hypothetical protein